MLSQFRFVILNERTLKEVWSVILSLRNVLFLCSLIVAFLVGMGILLITFTPLREYVPGYPQESERQLFIRNLYRIDSLEGELLQRDAYVDNIRRILENRETLPHYTERDSVRVTASTKSLQSVPIIDSSLYQHVSDERFSVHTIAYESVVNTSTNALRLHFYSPIIGSVSNNFNINESHYGIDIVSDSKAPILSVLDGTVIFSAWTLETGYVIALQHSGNIVSVYKHNSVLLKKMGERVSAGEPIGIVGNTGEYTTGAHLHFELWQDGQPLNPADYITF